jgi:hypothetical protein
VWEYLVFDNASDGLQFQGMPIIDIPHTAGEHVLLQIPHMAPIYVHCYHSPDLGWVIREFRVKLATDLKYHLVAGDKFTDTHWKAFDYLESALWFASEQDAIGEQRLIEVQAEKLEKEVAEDLSVGSGIRYSDVVRATNKLINDLTDAATCPDLNVTDKALVALALLQYQQG